MRTVAAALLSLPLAARWSESLPVVDEQAGAFHRGLGAHLLSHCLRLDLWACVAHQLHAQHFPAAAAAAGRSDVSTHLQVDAVLLRAAMRYLSAANSTDTGRGHDDKLVLPLMVAILMKTLGLLPLALGHLTFLGLGSVLASKVSLGLAALLLLRRWLRGDGSLLGQHTLAGLLRSAGLALPQFHQPPLPLDPALPLAALHPPEKEQAPAAGRRRKVIVLRQRGGRLLDSPAAATDVIGAVAPSGGTTVPSVD